MSNSIKIKVVFIIIAIQYLNAIFGTPIIFHACSAILIFWSFQIKAKYLLWEQIMYLFVVPFTLQSLLKSDWDSLLNSGEYLLTIVAYSRISRTIQYGPNELVVKYFLYLIVPVFVLFSIFNIPDSLLTGVRDEHIRNFSFSLLLPSSDDIHSFVRIVPPVFTKHVTGWIGLVLAIASFFTFQNNKNKVFIFGVIFGLYLLLFSGARTSVLVLFICVILLFINRNKFQKKFSAIVVLGTIITYFSINILGGYIIEIIPADSLVGTLFRLDSYYADYGLTANRDFLWKYHMDLFFGDPVLGAHSTYFDFGIGDMMPDGTIALASTESFYTFVLARYGILGLIYPILHFYLLKKMIQHKNIVGLVWVTVFILGNVFNSTFGAIYGEATLIYFVIFLSYNSSKYCETKKKLND